MWDRVLWPVYSLYHNLSNYQLNRLQQIQNSLARTVVKALKSSHITPILKYLHRLKVDERIEYKLLSLLGQLNTKFLQPEKPSYLHNLISLQPPCSTRSSSVVTLFFAHQPSPHWKSQIARSDVHHLDSVINFQIHFLNLASLVSIHLLIHFST